MNEEMKTLKKNRTCSYKIARRKKGSQVQGGKADGSIVANGFTQIHGLYFHETFALVEKVEICYKLFYP